MVCWMLPSWMKHWLRWHLHSGAARKDWNLLIPGCKKSITSSVFWGNITVQNRFIANIAAARKKLIIEVNIRQNWNCTMLHSGNSGRSSEKINCRPYRAWKKKNSNLLPREKSRLKLIKLCDLSGWNWTSWRKIGTASLSAKISQIKSLRLDKNTAWRSAFLYAQPGC